MYVFYMTFTIVKEVLSYYQNVSLYGITTHSIIDEIINMPGFIYFDALVEVS